MINQYIELNDVRLHYIERPAKTNLAIIFLHGRALSTDLWAEQFKSETLSAFRLIAVDLPGHGLSAHSIDFNSTYSISGLKSSLLELIERLDLDAFIIAGLSLGGHIALQGIPEFKNCKGIFAMTMPITKPLQATLMYQNLDLLGKVFQEKASSEDVEVYASELLRPGAENIPKFIEKSYYQADPKIHEGILNCLLHEAHLDEVEIIKNSKIPIAIVAGSKEQIHDLDYLKDFELPIWRNSIQMITNAGHLLPWENPEDVNRLLSEFADDCFHCDPDCK